MATDNPTVTYNGDHTVVTYTFAGLDNGDDGSPIKAPEFADKTYQVSGTFGVGGNVIIEGSNQDPPTTYFSLLQAGGVVGTDELDTITAAEGGAITENPLYLRPRVSAGDGTTDITVILTCRRPTDKRQ